MCSCCLLCANEIWGVLWKWLNAAYLHRQRTMISTDNHIHTQCPRIRTLIDEIYYSQLTQYKNTIRRWQRTNSIFLLKQQTQNRIKINTKTCSSPNSRLSYLLRRASINSGNYWTTHVLANHLFCRQFIFYNIIQPLTRLPARSQLSWQLRVCVSTIWAEIENESVCVCMLCFLLAANAVKLFILSRNGPLREGVRDQVEAKGRESIEYFELNI